MRTRKDLVVFDVDEWRGREHFKVLEMSGLEVRARQDLKIAQGRGRNDLKESEGA